MKPVELAPNEGPPEHPCADPKLYHSDIALLNYLLQDIRALVRQAAAGLIELDPYQQLAWEVHGLRRRTVICDPTRLVEHADVQIVGFFGNRRTDTNRDEIDEVNLGLLGEFRDYPGILSYSSVELVDDHWANLVVHAEPTDRERWRSSTLHIRAAEDLSPDFYHSVRIHNGCLPLGVVGPETVVIETTKYWDYDVSPAWRAQRALPEGATEATAIAATDVNVERSG